MGKYTVLAGQSPYDVALHLYGSIEGITDLLLCNPTLSLDTTLRSGEQLLYSDGYEIDSEVTTWFRSHGVAPAGGEIAVYPKYPTLPLLFEVRIPKGRLTAYFNLRGTGSVEIDWGDNSPLACVTLRDAATLRLEHTFDNSVAGFRCLHLFGLPTLRAADFTGLDPSAVYLFRSLEVESFILENTGVDLGFTALLQDTRSMNLRGCAAGDLRALLCCRALAQLDVRSEALLQKTVDDYLIGLVERYYGRRSCRVHLLTEPSGDYREPPRDAQGRYKLTTGMQAVWVLTHEESWNEAAEWQFDICGREYRYHKE